MAILAQPGIVVNQTANRSVVRGGSVGRLCFVTGGAMEDLERNTVKDKPSRIAILNASLDVARQARRADRDASSDTLLMFTAYRRALSRPG